MNRIGGQQRPWGAQLAVSEAHERAYGAEDVQRVNASFFTKLGRSVQSKVKTGGILGLATMPMQLIGGSGGILGAGGPLGMLLGKGGVGTALFGENAGMIMLVGGAVLLLVLLK